MVTHFEEVAVQLTGYSSGEKSLTGPFRKKDLKKNKQKTLFKQLTTYEKTDILYPRFIKLCVSISKLFANSIKYACCKITKKSR